MRTLKGLFNTNQVNLDGFAFPVEALEAYIALDSGTPMFVSHDMHRPVGWSQFIANDREKPVSLLTLRLHFRAGVFVYG
jgi:hypothetical protein